ncbi:taste receptor type 2 member 8-like [Rattus rattus]|uniref:taste receptor type 2 member 8-like n=1 Tax=Rattus rattus TaxID=10117 RepID=UPI0013F3442A|nr:taste receptor type 2 member 8-like [Rattus rattus]
MSSLQEILVVIFSVIEFIMGTLGNGFIVLINSTSWFKSRKISVIDFILTCSAISRMCVLWTTVAGVSFYKALFYSKSLQVFFDIIWTGSNYLCTACTTCISVFYLFKIANFSNPIFIWVKQRIHKVLLSIVLGTIIYFFLFLIFMKIITNYFIYDWTKLEQNKTFTFLDTLTGFLVYNVILIFFFAVSLTSFLLLIFSLWSHLRRMKLQGIHTKDTSTEAHIRAMKTIVSFLLFFIIYYITNTMLTFSHPVLDNVVVKTFSYILTFTYLSIHPFLLVLWNSKLKWAFQCVLRKLVCHS